MKKIHESQTRVVRSTSKVREEQHRRGQMLRATAKTISFSSRLQMKYLRGGNTWN